MPSSLSFIKISVEANGLCRLVLSRPKVNAMSPEYLSELATTFRSLDFNEAVKGVLISSDQSSFSAGLDLKAASQLTTEEKGVEFVKLIPDALCAPLALSKPVACAIEGHAIAGGFVLAASCDFVALSRTKDYLIGLTELNVGVPFPLECIESVRHHVFTSRGLRKFVYEGKTMSPLQAFEHGFGDVMVIDPILSATQWLRDRISLPTGIFELTKRQINAPFFISIAHPNDMLRGSIPIETHRQRIHQVMSKALIATQGHRGGKVSKNGASPSTPAEKSSSSSKSVRSRL